MSEHSYIHIKYKIGNIQNGLYVVSTPIGNSLDITIRALHILKNAKIIACEDTRVFLKLMKLHNIKIEKKRIIRYDEYSGAKALPILEKKLINGSSVALVSDAGTPLISDPGYKLLKAAQKKEINIFSIPGPSSVIASLSVSGCPPIPFIFLGFLPSQSSLRKRKLEEYAHTKATIICFETANRVQKTLLDMKKIYGDRDVSIARELTKIHEEILCGSLDNINKLVHKMKSIKGEMVILVSYKKYKPNKDIDNAKTLLKKFLNPLSISEAATEVAKITDFNKKELYKLGMDL